MIIARLKAAVDGFDGTFVEAHVLDEKLAKRVPKGLIGKALSEAQVSELLARLDGKSPKGKPRRG